ncbi:complement C1q tumor necrosis factor-related protein 2-like isoform X3 [Saccostrea cucullata]|uniref:complement C1q tumor necrosis factor-related protein 2-like isoform X3 n=1 Tax=Saccostrea cuccullata TaxID=36930 RepID=UPI002ED6AB07
MNFTATIIRPLFSYNRNMQWSLSVIYIVWIQIFLMFLPTTKCQMLYDSNKENWDLQKQMMKMKEEMIRLRQENQMNGKVVAFSATADSSIRQTITKEREIIILKKVLNNEGGGYNSETGIFTAPVAGNYAFYFSVQVRPNKRLSIYLYVNDDKAVEALAGLNVEHFDTGSNMVTLSLQKNDRVVVERLWPFMLFYLKHLTASQ